MTTLVVCKDNIFSIHSIWVLECALPDPIASAPLQEGPCGASTVVDYVADKRLVETESQMSVDKEANGQVISVAGKTVLLLSIEGWL